MTTPANTPPAVCPECEKATDTASPRCGNLWHLFPPTPTDEGRGTEFCHATEDGKHRRFNLVWCSECSEQIGPHIECPDADEDTPPSPQQGGGEEADLAALALEAMQVATKRAVYNGTGVILPWGVGMSVEQQFAAVLAERDRLRTALAESQRERDEARGMFEWAEHQRAVAQAKLAESQRREQEAQEWAGKFAAQAVEACGIAERLDATVARLTGELEEATRARERNARLGVKAMEERDAAEATLTEVRRLAECLDDESATQGVERLLEEKANRLAAVRWHADRQKAAEATLTALRETVDCACNALTDSITCSGNDAATNLRWVKKLRAEALTPSDTGSQG